jgi:peptide/nickel transport system permease protein
VLTGDLGTALTSGSGHRHLDLAAPLEHAVPRLLGAAIVGAAGDHLGLLAVRYRNGPVDKLISGFALASTSLPEFFIGYLLVFFFAVKLQMVPGISTVYRRHAVPRALNAIALPATALTLVVLAHMMRMTRAAILNVMQSAYIETAELKGLSPSTSSASTPSPTRSRRSSTW